MDFNSFARKYDKYNKMHFGKGYEEFRKATVSRADFKRYKAIFEFGCGTSLCLEHILANHDFAGLYIGADVSSGMLEVAREKFQENDRVLHVRISADGRLPISDGAVDAVFSSLVFHLIPVSVRSSILQEFNRILKPGGNVYMNEFGYPSTMKGRLFKIYVKYFWSFIVKEERNAVRLLDGKFMEELRQHFSKVDFYGQSAGVIDHILLTKS